MLRAAVVLVVLSCAGPASAQSVSCGALSAPVSPVQRTMIAPVAAEFSTSGRQLGAPAGVLSQALSDSLSLDEVLFRMQVESCGSLASIAPIPSPASLPVAPIAAPDATTSITSVPAATDPAAYKPQTEFDNTPWRFDMNQNGKSMTADEFDAWMNAKGLRVVGGKFVRVPVQTAVGTAPVTDAVVPTRAQSKDE